MLHLAQWFVLGAAVGGHGFNLVEFKPAGTKEHWACSFFCACMCCCFSDMVKNTSMSQKTCFACFLVSVVGAAYFSFGSTVSSRRFVFYFISYFFCDLYFFCPPACFMEDVSDSLV